ncbi:hypothetical protein BS78_K172900 [Paspalum vaginatum]|uniref:F-box domain-containing protein n=1 Tax=Paspalum vaginatum TaxID=158149 RepID=A0A9W7X973_9POAL|nr:hypothetical protein BS78_K172900 [Paspalum vaginatum]
MRTFGGGVDHLSTLPDEVLQQILSLLPVKEAVQTCVLARSWRDIWKLTRHLRITASETPAYVEEVRGFVNSLLWARGGAPLDTCEIKFDAFEEDDEPLIHRWISLVVSCRVQSLLLHIYDIEDEDRAWFEVLDEPLVSSYLTRLVLYGIEFSQGFGDFSSCPALQDLEASRCDFAALVELKSPSLKHLSFYDCTSCPDSRFRIRVPSLVSLWMDVPSAERTPQLESMLELVVAYLDIKWCLDKCTCGVGDRMDFYHVTGAHLSSDSEIYEQGHDEEGFDDDSQVAVKSVLLEGLSEAADLTLLSDPTMYIFRRDLRWCPTFSKLKTLLINDYWCEPTDCRPLACILEHSPVLEKLTILLSGEGPKYKLEMKGGLNGTERPAMISKRLSIVLVKCDVVDETLNNVLKFLASLNICKITLTTIFAFYYIYAFHLCMRHSKLTTLIE